MPVEAMTPTVLVIPLTELVTFGRGMIFGAMVALSVVAIVSKVAR